jgi:Cu(I)/Ag(I) efflux system membrane fusion protein
LIPASAPLITGTRAVVYVELPGGDDPVFEGREIQLGPRAGDYYVVMSGLEEGDMVVTNGAFKLDAELQIQAKPSMMLPDGGGTPAGHNHGQSASAVASTESTTMDMDMTSETGDTEIGAMDISTEARSALNPLYSDYFEVQSALAGDDLDGAQKAYAKMNAAIKHVDMELFTGEAHHAWMSLSSAAEKKATEGASAKTIAEARDVFGKLSEKVIELHSAFGHAGDAPYYLTFCPMAFDNNGAYWLQTEPVVSNSFYGAAMLRCGSIKDTLPPGTTKRD